MSSVAIHITLEPMRGKPVSLARLCELEILQCAARAAILDARRKAVAARDVDDMLAQIRGEEADQLERYLSALIPGLVAAETLNMQ